MHSRCAPHYARPCRDRASTTPSLPPALPPTTAGTALQEARWIAPASILPLAASFVVCDKRDDINGVEVPDERLRQWRCGAEAVGAFVAQSLGLRADSQRKADAGLWELGLLRGKKRSQMVCLRANEALELVAAQNAVPLTELVRFGAEGYSVDCEAIRQLVDAASTGDSRYTPSNARREARKLATQALHEGW